jgi:C1A family cysteine protease/uncharacterized protein YjdB
LEGKKVKINTLSRKILSVLVIASLIFSNPFIVRTLPVKADTNQYTLQVGQINPQLGQYIQSGVKAKGLIPLPVKLNNVQANNLTQATSLPAQYDLRTLSRLSPVRDQGQIGSCWSFGTYGSLESWMLTNSLGQQDYSENNMITQHGFDAGPNDGGNMYMATAYLARWSGPVSETDDPYANPPDPSNIVVRNGKVAQQHIQDIIFIPDRANATDNTDLKNAIMQYGDLYTSMYYGDSYFKSSTNSYYCNNSGIAQSGNHAVGIVGWNDTYSRNNFAIVPPGDGAFIIRNSWGSSWGDGGYFYVSYYDAFIGKENAAFTNAQPTNNFDHIYQYDPLGMVDDIGFNNSTAWFSNVFPAPGSESLAATGFYTTQKSAQYQVYVETDYDTNHFSKLTLVKSGTIDMPGYHTVTLDTPVALNSGKRFAIAVKLVEANETIPIAIEEYYSGYSSNATASVGQSFTSPDGQAWTDLMVSQPSLKANVCLKAFTKNSTAPVNVTGVSLDKTAITLNPLNTQTLIATVTPTNATNKNVTWTSSNTSVATVANGVVTANAVGTAVITATTADGGYTATCNVTVTSSVVNVTGVSLDKTAITLNPLNTQTLIATVTPTNATNKNVTWSSSNGAVATVTNGVVTANAVGTAVITVTTADGGYTATCNVTVTNPTGLTSINEGFDSVVGTSSSITSGIPTGWTFTSGMAVYTTSSNYGLSAPSIKMQATGNQMTTPTFNLSAQGTLSFWIKGEGTNSTSHLLVEKFDGTSWTTVQDISSLPTTGTTKTFTIAQNIKQIRFTYNKSVGNLAIDDIHIN